MMKHSACIATALLLEALLTSSPAARESTRILWPERPERNQPEGRGKERERRGKRMVHHITTPTLRIYEAPQSEPPTPAVLLIPGGGYKRVVTSIHEPIAAWLQEQGIRPFMLVYRCPADRKAPDGPVQDVQRAIRMLRANARTWNIDPDRIGVLGSSAGGNLAVRASVSSGATTYTPTSEMDQLSAKPDFTLLLYPAWVGHRGTGGLSKWVHVRSDFGPTFITAARDDKHFGSAPPYGTALRAAGVPVEELYFDEGGHGFSLREPEAIASWPEAALAFLKEQEFLP